MSEIIRAGRFEIAVLYEDNHLLAVIKPPNLPVQRDISGDDDLLCILKAHIGYKYHKPGAVYLGLVHRLDRPVGGVMVFARTSKAAARLSEAFARQRQEKTYLAVLRGNLADERVMENHLAKGPDGMVRVVDEHAPGAKLARLSTAPLAHREGLTLARVELFTGRSHQIRVQHAHAGMPLWGDARYGDGRPGQQIALWACRLVFEHPTRGEPLALVAPPPRDGIWAEFADAIDDVMEGLRK